MKIKQADTMLLVIPLAGTLQKRLIDRAAFVASKKALDVVVYTPVLSTSFPDSEMSLQIENHAGAEGMAMARAHAAKSIRELRSRGIAARARVDAQQSVLRGALELVEREEPELMMISASDYDEWADQSLTDGGLLDTCPVPVWVENAAKTDVAVLGAVELDPRSTETAALDDRVASEAHRIADDLGAASHVVHSLTRQAEVPRFIETAVPGDMIDKAHQALENRHVKMAHELAKRHEIVKENIHLERGEATGALARTAKAVKAGVIVMGATKRNRLQRLMFESAPHRLLGRLHADVLIINQEAV